jgi:hypothetical protein
MSTNKSAYIDFPRDIRAFDGVFARFMFQLLSKAHFALPDLIYQSQIGRRMKIFVPLIKLVSCTSESVVIRD